MPNKPLAKATRPGEGESPGDRVNFESRSFAEKGVDGVSGRGESTSMSLARSPSSAVPYSESEEMKDADQSTLTGSCKSLPSSSPSASSVARSGVRSV